MDLYFVRVCWEHLGEVSVDSHLQQNFFCILRETEDIESEWAVFHTSIAEVAMQNCKAVGAS